MMLQTPGPFSVATPISVILATDSENPSGVGHHMLALAAHLGPGFLPHLVFTRAPLAKAFVTKAIAFGLRAETVASDDWAHWLSRHPGPLLHVHAGIGWEGLSLVAAGQKAGFTVLRTEHLPWLIDKPTERQDYAAMLRNVAQLITVSPGAVQGWQSALSRMPHHAPVTAIPNGIVPPKSRTPASRVRRSLGIGPDQPLLLHVGRFTAQKAHSTLVAAYAIVQQSFPNVRLVMVGDGPLCGAIKDQIEQQALTGITILPLQNDIAGLMRAADLLVLPSLFEGLPLVALEAMAAHLPIIATRTDGIVDALGSDHLFLVAPNAPAALAQCITTALGDPVAAGRVAERQMRRFHQ